jgi:hypothetical protein
MLQGKSNEKGKRNKAKKGIMINDYAEAYCSKRGFVYRIDSLPEHTNFELPKVAEPILPGGAFLRLVVQIPQDRVILQHFNRPAPQLDLRRARRMSISARNYGLRHTLWRLDPTT